MDDLSITDTDRHMVDRLTVTIENQIARLCFRYLDRGAAIRLRHRRVRQADTVFLKDA